jgi:hypothetical protein
MGRRLIIRVYGAGQYSDQCDNAPGIDIGRLRTTSLYACPHGRVFCDV